MRPTITEQLDGLRRILSEVIAPEVTAPYPSEILASVIGALDALRTNWASIPDYLEWEVRSIRAILVAANIEVPADNPRDPKALEDLQIHMSGQLVTAQPAIAADTDGDAYRLMIAFFRERAQRFPFSMTARPPKKEG
jgi:hypothetical protein